MIHPTPNVPHIFKLVTGEDVIAILLQSGSMRITPRDGEGSRFMDDGYLLAHPYTFDNEYVRFVRFLRGTKPSVSTQFISEQFVIYPIMNDWIDPVLLEKYLYLVQSLEATVHAEV